MDAELRPLDPRLRVVWVLRGLIGALVLGGIAGASEFLVVERPRGWPLPRGAGTALLALFLVARAVVWPPLLHRSWRYGLRPRDLFLSYGVIWRVQRSVPRSRIQHVDVQSGPVERAFGLATLVVYTAGTGDADAQVPGLPAAEAEALRETLLHPEGPDA
jgi:membrane protein YdbS with pleckstrin-like domain